ncbi:hypothetical protein GCM10027515_26530 [Schumannella luteola]|uniref:Uncharacterized protein n=1 Tax=Schumannella luteola TaxID=472059 RepID=A0A852YE15_9MICO|nr:hypothetical protein [Schumannella luteola]NYG99550.1 hypothetical protein [Schumannella luteola]TPX03867.1 hypothetical protein FJ656_15155 [Schumannella luteola]
MANGDKAAAKGWATVPSTRAHSTGYDDINGVLDRVADEQDRAKTEEAKKSDKADSIISTSTPPVRNNAVWFKPVG